jgi:hypothetical protein
MTLPFELSFIFTQIVRHACSDEQVAEEVCGQCTASPSLAARMLKDYLLVDYDGPHKN